MLDEVPKDIVHEIYAINELNRDTNDDFLLAMTLLKSEQDQDNKLQEIIKLGGALTFFLLSTYLLDKKK